MTVAVRSQCMAVVVVLTVVVVHGQPLGCVDWAAGSALVHPRSVKVLYLCARVVVCVEVVGGD